jgi:MarR family transcriptional regulator, organic hydroperoxide resistance regulator
VAVDHSDAQDIGRMAESLYRFTTAAERRQADIARRAGLSASESRALMHLRFRGPRTPGELGDLLSLTSGGTTALLHRLNGQGLIERQAHPFDGRSSRVAITASGELLAQELAEPLLRALRAASAPLTPDDGAAMTDWMTSVVNHLASEIGTFPAADKPGEPPRPQPVPGAPFPNLWF